MPIKPPTFRHARAQSGAEKAKEYDGRRGSAHQRGYDSKWQAASNSYRRLHPLCVGCKAVGLFVAAVLVDHVVPHKGDRVLFWQRCNWQSACQWHHDVIKQRLELRYAEGGLADADLRLDSAAAVALTQQMSTPYPPSKL